jgi:hypothetical protein
LPDAIPIVAQFVLTVDGSPREVPVKESLLTGLGRLLLFQPGVPQRVAVLEQVIELLQQPESSNASAPQPDLSTPLLTMEKGEQDVDELPTTWFVC